MFESSRKSTIAVQIHAQLRRQIILGTLTPRQPLSENELSASLGVSRTPVREALGKLEKEGLIQIIPQYGTFVSPIQVDQVYSNQFVREALECAALPLAAAHCTVADGRQLRALLSRQRACDDDTAFFACDEAMHALLMAIAGQERAWDVVETAKLHLDRVRHLAVRSPLKRKSIIAEHVVIVGHVLAGDAEAAVGAMRSHLRGVFASIEPVMQQHPQFFSDNTAETRPLRRASKADTPVLGSKELQAS
ncbi:MAG: GntR family transcriptional regulator [Acetobacteraceae bacterium]